jgi:ABC-2 type transport system ATP-binding protein
MAEAEALCDRIAIVDHGRIVALDTPAGLRAMVRDDAQTEPTLEDVFLKLTGRSLEEDQEEKPK